MDRRLEICDWFRKMGYDGDFPENLDRICNNSTSFIWDQLIENTKPKAEAENIKHNILATRLTKFNLKKDGEIKYPLKEIKLYSRKKDLEKELENINYSISEKQKTYLKLQQENRIKRFSIEKTQLKIKENEEREFILKEKCKILESDTKCAGHIIESKINTTASEQENIKDITHTLNDCMETLKTNIKHLPFPIRNTQNKTINRLLLSTQKTGRKKNMFEKYLSSTESQTTRKPSAKKNIHLYSAANRVNVRLFSDENDSINPNTPKINLYNSRDSIELGIKFDDEDDENFLVNVSKARPLNYKLDLPQTLAKKRMDSSYLFKINENVSIYQETNETVIKNLFNESVSNDIENLLCHHIRQNVWNAFQERDDKLHFNISKKINFWPLKSFSTQKEGSKDIAKLQAIHIQTEFRIIKNNLILKQLTEKLNEKKKNIHHTLNDCMETLKTNIKHLPFPIRNTQNKTINRLLLSTQKTGRKKNMFEKYLSSTESQTTRKPSAKKNIHLYSAANRVNVRLFSDENDSINPNTPKINLYNSRDSIELGIKFDDEDDENFLVNVSKARPLNYKLDLPQTLAKKRMDSSYLFKINENVSIYQETNETVIKNLFNESVSNDIENLLCHHIRQNVWNAFQERDDKLHFNISKKINFWPLKSFSTQKEGSKDIAKLQAIHIQTEFRIIKNNLILKQLTEKLNEKKKNIHMTLINSGYPKDIIDVLQRKILFYIEGVGMDFTIESMKKEIITQNTEEVTTESDIKKKLIETKENISLKKNSIIEYLGIIQDIFYFINHTRSLTSSCVRKLAPYTSNLEWCSLLKETVNTNEIAVFEEFPLEYNRRCINTYSSVYYKDIHSDKFLCNREIDNENLILLSKILESPFSAPETILLDILRGKRKLEVLKSIKCIEHNYYKKCSLADLQTQETYIENILDRFKALIVSSSSKKTLSSSSAAKEIMEIWTEIPFKEFISPNRTLDDKDYKHYEKLFDFYNNF